jgi:hypothetical protein
MSRSQETFLKRQREKDRNQKKKAKREKRDAKREHSTGGLEIDWSSAPENKTLTPNEEKLRASNKKSGDE